MKATPTIEVLVESKKALKKLSIIEKQMNKISEALKVINDNSNIELNINVISENKSNLFTKIFEIFK